MFVLVYLYVVYNNNNSSCVFVYVCLCLVSCSLCLCVCVCFVCLSIRVVFNNLRANRLGQWILSDAYLVALCAKVERTGCISGHICPIAIPVAILHIQILFAIRIICIVVAAAAAHAAAAAVDGRLSQSIADAQA